MRCHLVISWAPPPFRCCGDTQFHTRMNPCLSDRRDHPSGGVGRGGGCAADVSLARPCMPSASAVAGSPRHSRSPNLSNPPRHLSRAPRPGSLAIPDWFLLSSPPLLSTRAGRRGAARGAATDGEDQHKAACTSPGCCYSSVARDLLLLYCPPGRYIPSSPGHLP